MSTTLALRDLPQLVRQLLRQGLDGGLGDVVSGVAGRAGDARVAIGVEIAV